MSIEMLQRQVRALRATAASLLAQLETLAESVEAARATVPCDHPEKDRDARVSTFDQPERWMCKLCGFIGGEKAAKE